MPSPSTLGRIWADIALYRQLRTVPTASGPCNRPDLPAMTRARSARIRRATAVRAEQGTAPILRKPLVLLALKPGFMRSGRRFMAHLRRGWHVGCISRVPPLTPAAFGSSRHNSSQCGSDQSCIRGRPPTCLQTSGGAGTAGKREPKERRRYPEAEVRSSSMRRFLSPAGIAASTAFADPGGYR